MKVATRDGDTLIIRFDFSWNTLAAVKRIPGRRFHPKPVKHWTAPVTETAYRVLKGEGFLFEGPDGKQAPDVLPVVREVEVLPCDVPGLRKPLFPFQQLGVGFLEAKNGRALIADEMGLGKTLTAIAWLTLHPEKRPAIIVCPAHLKLHWEREIRQASPHAVNTQILFGTNTNVPLTGDVIIVNYDILFNHYEDVPTTTGKVRKKEIPHTGWVDFLIALQPQVLVIDEAHYCRSNKALRAKATRKLAKKTPHVIALTGTPIVNRPIEGFNIIRLIDPSIFPNFWEYVQRYCDAKQTFFGWDFTGASNQDELNARLTSTVMIRRLKENVLQELPDKVRAFIPVELENREVYDEAEQDFIGFIRRTRGPQAAQRAKAAEYLTRIEALKQLAVQGKMAQATRWIKDFLDGGQKLVVFAIHKQVVHELATRFHKVAVVVDGGCTATQRDQAVQAFQNDSRVRLFIGNIQAAGTGLTLTSASSVAFLELPWTSGEVTQAEDRCHRIGQKDVVNIYYILAGDTIEERIAELLDAKRQVLSAVLDGREAKETELLTELLHSYE